MSAVDPLHRPTLHTPCTIADIAAAMQAEEIVYNTATMRILCAQWACEHGCAGFSFRSVWSHNLGNKRPKSKEPYCILRSAHENAKPEKVPADATLLPPDPKWATPVGEVAYMPNPLRNKFCAWPTLREGVRALHRFYAEARFAKAMAAAAAGDLMGFVFAIHAQKYFTADVHKYHAVLRDNLTRYDRWVASLPDLEPCEPAFPEVKLDWFDVQLQLGAKVPPPAEWPSALDMIKSLGLDGSAPNVA